MRRWLALLLLAGSLLTACDRDPAATAELDGRLALPDDIARAIAAALVHTDVRQALIAQMRRSPRVEHRIHLLDAVQSADGVLLRRAAAAAGVSTGAFIASVSALPTMEFYGAGAHQRRTWTASGGAAAVALSVDGKNHVIYDRRGQTAGPFDSRAFGIVFVLAPVESWLYRIGWRADPGPGSVIEDAEDGAGGFGVTVTNDRGGIVLELDFGKERLPLRSLNAEMRRRLPALSTGQWAASASTMQSASMSSTTSEVGTAVQGFRNNFIQDPIWPEQDAEIELKAWKNVYPQGSTCCRLVFSWDGVSPGERLVADPAVIPLNDRCAPPEDDTCVDGPFPIYLDWYPTSNGYNTAMFAVTESDNNAPDDNYGYHFWTVPESGELKGYHGKWNSGWGGTTIGRNGTTDCHSSPDVECALLLVAFNTNIPDPPPPPPPGPLTAFVSGPGSVKPGAICTWHAGHNGSGSAPYSYTWSGALSGGPTSSDIITGTVETSGWLNVLVSSSDGQEATNRIWVEVTSDALDCIL